jgi:hypothetical protein
MGHFGREKATSTVINILGAVMIAAILVFFFFYIFPLFFGDVFKSIALSSSEVVARDIAGLVSVSGVAPDEIKIEYNPSTSITYNVTIVDRIVRVFLGVVRGVPFSGQNEVASAKTAVDNLNAQIILTNIFEISKKVSTGIDANGNKIFKPVYSIIGIS